MSSSTAGQSAGQLETRGIEPKPEAECNGHPLQLFWVWFAANISILGLPLGATLVAFRGLGDLRDHRHDPWRCRFLLRGGRDHFHRRSPWSRTQPDAVAGDLACAAISARRWFR